ncbi:20362_t:CDS:1 [Dentiscutata erythropus]|uniref:20362_t:CDS:1 n=1 Tax=Dentiscutata erythropus TaxID=1348616 RepID=A0A9N9HRT7_9GLOM|nr:20362_t:CDS:1 [Dentiscutata erythropus]
MIVSKILTKVDSCVVGFCNDDRKLNICRNKREYGLSINTEYQFSPQNEIIENSEDTKQNIYFQVSKQRLIYIYLFQKINTKQTNLELHDIAIQLKLTTYHNQDKERRIQLPIEKSESRYITPLIESLILKIFIIEICDRDVAIQTDPSIGDIILDRDIQNIQFREYITPHLETELKVECGQDHEINLCLNLNKLKACLLENDQNDVKIFNQENFALVGFVDYCNMFYKFKQENRDKDFLFFGENFSSIKARSGIPFFLHGGYVETSWKPNFETASSIENLFLLV